MLFSITFFEHAKRSASNTVNNIVIFSDDKTYAFKHIEFDFLNDLKKQDSGRCFHLD